MIVNVHIYYLLLKRDKVYSIFYKKHLYNLRRIFINLYISKLRSNKNGIFAKQIF